MHLDMGTKVVLFTWVQGLCDKNSMQTYYLAESQGKTKKPARDPVMIGQGRELLMMMMGERKEKLYLLIWALPVYKTWPLVFLSW